MGVDVFFVISGFVITGLLLRERQSTGGTSIVDFYARRCRRILPAATLVILVTVAFSYLLLGAASGNIVADDGRWAAAFLSNVHFASVGTNYFTQSQPPSPLQNYWSLAVEEQFYIVFPTVIAFVAAVRDTVSMRARLLCVLGVVIATSYWLSIAQTASSPTSAYFSPFTRAWELALGAMVAVGTPWLQRVPRQSRDVSDVAGDRGDHLGNTDLHLVHRIPGVACRDPRRRRRLRRSRRRGATSPGCGDPAREGTNAVARPSLVQPLPLALADPHPCGRAGRQAEPATGRQSSPRPSGCSAGRGHVLGAREPHTSLAAAVPHKRGGWRHTRRGDNRRALTHHREPVGEPRRCRRIADRPRTKRTVRRRAGRCGIVDHGVATGPPPAAGRGRSRYLPGIRHRKPTLHGLCRPRVPADLHRWRPKRQPAARRLRRLPRDDVAAGARATRRVATICASSSSRSSIALPSWSPSRTRMAGSNRVSPIRCATSGTDGLFTGSWRIDRPWSSSHRRTGTSTARPVLEAGRRRASPPTSGSAGCLRSMLRWPGVRRSSSSSVISRRWTCTC